MFHRGAQGNGAIPRNCQMLLCEIWWHHVCVRPYLQQLHGELAIDWLMHVLAFVIHFNGATML